MILNQPCFQSRRFRLLIAILGVATLSCQTTVHREDRLHSSETSTRNLIEEKQISLKILENKLIDDRDWELYSKFLDYFLEVDENIQFLTLTSYPKRIEWLRANQFSHRPALLRSQFAEQISRKELKPGMPMFIVREILGDPSQTEVSGNPKLKNHRWIYKKERDLATQQSSWLVLTFERGKLSGWQTEREL